MTDSPKYDEARRRFLRHAAIVGFGLAAPLIIPAAAEAGGLFNLTPSISDQKKLGDQAAQQILKQYKEVHDGRARHFNDLGERLVAALPDSDRQTWDFRYHVLDSKEINAFALPGGNMFMFTGLYEKVPTDDALAAVTGHEMTHVRKQHWAKAYADQQKRGLGITALAIIFHVNQDLQSVAGLADSTYDLKFSRKDEDQADQGGLENMVAAGYNPEGMIQLFDVLKKSSGNGNVGPFGDFLSDHPLTSDRIKHAQQRIADLEHNHQFPPLTPLDYKALMA